MKIIDKVKTIFWDNDDEDEDEVEETPIVKRKQKEEQQEVVNERDLFKTDASFKFPVVFTEEDFAKTIPPERVVSSKPKHEAKKDLKDKNTRAKSTAGKAQETSKPQKQEPIKTFKLSPAISPIYGVLDKNYKKEDIKTKNTNYSKRDENEISFENVRRKAYGSLTEEIEKTMVTPIIKKEEIKEQPEEKINPNKNVTIEEAIENYNDLGMVYNTDANTEEDIIKLKKDKKNILEDTIEQDLFNLIDSMYDKEEEDSDGTSK